MSYTRNNPVLAPRYDQPKEKKKKKGLADYLMIGFIAVVLGIAGFAVYSYFAPGMKEVPNRVAEGLQQDRLNLLLIGVGGDAHPGEGKDLADAIMLLSLKPSTRQVAVISLPRDLFVPMDNGIGMQRLNAAHALGRQIGFRGHGAGFLMHTIERIFGQPVHAYARIDFKAFEKVIDALGGVDIYVYRPFYDVLFKDGFEQGWQHMDGQRALRYARYRYIDSFEGNTFGRDMRQQQVIDAIRAKAKNLDAGQILRITQLAMNASDYTSTNLTTAQMVQLYTTFRNSDRESIRNVSLKKFTKVIMVTDPRLAGEAVAPPNNDFTKIRQVVATVFDGRGPIVAPGEIQLTDVGKAPAAPRRSVPIPPEKAEEIKRQAAAADALEIERRAATATVP